MVQREILFTQKQKFGANMFKTILKKIMNGENNISDPFKIKEEDSRPCPACAEELDRMDRCLQCGCDITYVNQLCYEVDREEQL